MKLEWMGEYRDIVGDFYRSANGYSQICKRELFGDKGQKADRRTV